MASDSGFFEIVTKDRNHAEGFNGIKIVDNLTGAFAGILRLEFLGGGSSVDQREVEDLFLRMLFRARMWSAAVKPKTLIGLSHQVADVDLGRRRFDDRLRNAAHQQIGNQAGEQ